MTRQDPPVGIGGQSERLAVLVWVTGAVLVIPFLISAATIDPALAPRFLALSLLSGYLCLALAPTAARLDFAVARRLVFPLLLAYAGLAAVSLPFAINPNEGIPELLKILLAILFLYLSTLLLTRRPTAVEALAKAMMLASATHAIIGIAQYHHLAFNAWPGNFVIYSTMTNKNLYAEALFLSLPFQLYGGIVLARPYRWFGTIALLLTVHCIALAQSRAVWLALLASAVAMAVFVAAPRLRSNTSVAHTYLRRLKASGLMAVAVIVVSLYAIGDGGFRAVLLRPDAPVSSIDERLTLWRKTEQMIRDHPLLGVGLANWRIHLPRYGTEGMRSQTGEVHFQRPHNDFLCVLSESGPMAALLYLGAFVTVLAYGFSLLRNRHTAEAERILVAATAAGVVGYVAIASFSFPRERIAHTVYLLLLFASTVSLYHRTVRGTHESRPVGPAYVFGPLLVVCSVCVLVGWGRLRAEVHTKRALEARERADWRRVISEIDQAESWLARLDPMGTPLVWYRGVAQLSLGSTRAALEDFQRAAREHPFHIHVLNNLGSCYERGGDHQAALSCYSRALDISPRFEEALLNMAATHYNAGDYRRADAALDRCDPLSRNPRLLRLREAVGQKLHDP